VEVKRGRGGDGPLGKTEAKLGTRYIEVIPTRVTSRGGVGPARDKMYAL
jgi:hypothetical protein